MARAVVVGGGANGLAAATTLARGGREVTLIEARDGLGGLSAGASFHEGYRHAGILHDTGAVRPWLVKDLDLEAHGLDTYGAPSAVFAPERGGGRGVVLHHSPELSEGELRTRNDVDAAAYRGYRAFLDRVRGAAGPLFDEAPPDLVATIRGQLRPLLRPGFALRRLGAETLNELLRIPPMPVADFAGDWFRCELVRAAVAAPAVDHAFTGPWSPGSAGTLLHRELTHTGSVKGGPAAFAAALEAAATAAGVTARTGTRVERIVVEGGAARGVRLAGGETLDADLVLSAVDPRATFLDLLEPAVLPYTLERRIRHFRGEGTTGKVHLALRGAPNWACRPGERFARLRIGETVDDLERAFDPVKYREIPRRPALDVFVPTVETPDLAPRGNEVLSILVHAVPYDPADGGWNADARQDFENVVLDTLELYTPGIKKQITGAEFLLPPDLEARYGAVRGHLLHGEHALDQLLVRPTPETARYATPIRGLFLGGGGSFPGGGVSGAPGALAGRTALEA